MASSNDFFGLSQTIPLSEVAEVNASTVNPSKTYRWISYTDISSVGEHSVQEPLMMPAETAPSRARRELQFGDIVISTVRPNRRSFFRFENQWENPICSTGFAVVSPKNASDSEYLYALLTSHAATDFYESICEGGAYPAFNGAKLHNMAIPWPESCTRNAIGTIAADLRKKIEVNKKIASTLEQIAQTIFKSWFVDFDPVHAKARGEQPVGMDAETAALFPDSFEDSELGPIPTGWKVSPICECSKVVVGGTPSRKVDEYWDGTIPWINSGKTNEFRVTQPSEYITELGVQKSAAKLMPVGTTIMAMTGATLGQFSRMEIQACGTQNVIGILDNGTWPNEFIYFTIAFAMDKVLAGATGGAPQHVRKSIVEEILVINPGHELSVRFAEVVLPLFNQIANLEFQNHSLIEIRDSLLPRLISGELEIPAELLEA